MRLRSWFTRAGQNGLHLWPGVMRLLTLTLLQYWRIQHRSPHQWSISMCILTWLLVKADIQRSLNQFSSRFALRSSFPCTHAPSNMIHSSLSLSLKPEFFDWQHANEPFIDTRPTRPIGLAYTASDVPPTTLLLGRIAVLRTQMLPLPTETEFILIGLRKQLLTRYTTPHSTQRTLLATLASSLTNIWRFPTKFPAFPKLAITVLDNFAVFVLTLIPLQLVNYYAVLKATEFGEITQNNGSYGVQGHSRSPILVPVERSYETSY